MQQDSSRTALGYTATQCACSDCAINCRYIPGYLIPEDLNRMWQGIEPEAETLQEFADKHLLASPVAQVGVRDQATGEIQIFSIPTLVPARKEDGSCIFLTDENECSVHYAAPYGCRFFDAHMSSHDADIRSAAGLQQILDDNKVRGPYKQIWDRLNDAKRIAPSPAESRAAMQGSLDRLAFVREAVPEMQARLGKAFNPLVAVEWDKSGMLPPYRPGQHRRHVFDFDDGLRLILSRDDRDPSGLSPGVVMHLSGSFEPETRLYHRLQTKVRKRTQELERTQKCFREEALPQAVNEMKDYFVEYVGHRFAELTGYTLTSRPIWTQSKGIPHWFEAWTKFEAATNIQPQE